MNWRAFRRAAALFTVIAALAAAPAVAQETPAVFDPSGSDEEAIRIADEVLAKIGAEKWKNVRYISFRVRKMIGDTAQEERRYYWDRKANLSRMESPSKTTGKPVVVLVDQATNEGEASHDGQLVPADKATKLIEFASMKLREEIFWLDAPFRLKEPGARLRYEGEKKAGPVTFDMIEARFAATPDVKYRFYIDRDTKTIESVSFVLKGRNVTPVAFNWVDWTDIAGMKFSLRKTQSGGDLQIVIDEVRVYESLPETVFNSTEPLDPSLLTASAR